MNCISALQNRNRPRSDIKSARDFGWRAVEQAACATGRPKGRARSNGVCSSPMPPAGQHTQNAPARFAPVIVAPVNAARGLIGSCRSAPVICASFPSASNGFNTARPIHRSDRGAGHGCGRGLRPQAQHNNATQGAYRANWQLFLQYPGTQSGHHSEQICSMRLLQSEGKTCPSLPHRRRGLS